MRRLLPLLAVAACASPSTDAADLSADRLLADIAVLADDSLLGRAPGTEGETRTVAFLSNAFAEAGLQPGNPDGSWTQAVELVGIESEPVATFRAGGRVLPMKWRDDFVAVSRRTSDVVEVPETEMLFVGYGVVAPEYDWNDYKDVDVRGKVVVMLVNDPAVPDPADPARLDSTMFRGEAMTYYGRWTYKYEIATEMGAAAVLVIHEDGPAGYPWEVVRGGWSGERMETRSADGNQGRVAVEGWISEPKVRELLTAAGEDFDSLKARAASRDFVPQPIAATAGFRIDQRLRDVSSRNVVGILPGSDESVRDEYVVFTAHWDHFGIGEPVDGDSIYNGARDNASGTAALIELARAFVAEGAPRRSIVFLAVTAEEQGLLGAKWYANHPLYPLEKTLANINVDVLNTWGATRDIVAIGYGNSSLDDVLGAVAAEAGRTVSPDPEPAKGFFYRSDHFEFAKQGVPALYTDEGTDYIDHPAGFGEERRNDWTANLYHKPADEVDPAWDLSGAIADLQLLYGVGRRVADGEVWPTWREGTEFKAIREASLR